MSDPDKSGAPTPAPADLTAPAPAPAEAAPASPAAAAPVSETPKVGQFGQFGGTRGSGLLRGKRPSTAAASSAGTPTPPAGFKPTALEVINAQSEYKNPFTGETSVTAPRTNEPAPPAVPLPSPAADKEVAATAPANSPVPE